MGRAAGAALRRVRPDHRAISLRQIRVHPDAMARHYLYVSVAPSRWAMRPSDDEAVARAQAFAARIFPGVFASRPASSNADVVVFRSDSGEESSVWERRLLVHRTGLVELLWAVDLVSMPDGDGELLPILDVLRPLQALATGVATAEYARLSRLHCPWRRFARVDWWLAVTTSTATQTGPRCWRGVSFPGAAPERSQHDRGYMPRGGYGDRALKSSSRRGAPGRVPVVLLRELLQANGYFNADAAVAETLAALEASPPLQSL